MISKKNQAHFIGIGGIGVSALAQYYLATGHKVSGSDLASSEITEFLKKKGAEIYIGQKAGNIKKGIDKVIYSPAIKEDNPELKQARKLKIKCLTYPESLGELTKNHFTIAIAGAHGKSTTTSMISVILVKAGLDPTVIVGTKLKEFGNSNFRMGKSNYLVVEACEYEESFLNYYPNIIIITNIEEEHLDYFKNLNNILKAFRKFVSRLKKGGLLVVNKEDKNIFQILNSKQTSNIIYYSINQKEAEKIKKILKIPGEHNVSNALAAMETARALKIPDKVSFKALSDYKGCWRRFEIVQRDIISDYAHHPTEIRATLKAVREKFPRKKIWCVFQPHQYQRTHFLFKDFVDVFRQGLREKWIDRLIIVDIYDVAGREEKSIKKRVSSKSLAGEIDNAVHVPAIKDAENYLKKNSKSSEVILIMGAGDIDKLARLFHR